MKRLIATVCFLLLSVATYSAKATSGRELGAKLVSRAVELVGDSGAYIHDIPLSPRRDEPGLARHLAKQMVWFRDYARQKGGRNDPVIVISDDPALGARVAHAAFSSLRAGSLRGLRVICIVGKRYDAYLHTAADATAVNLQVEPLPK
jgi:hypothetical protein